MLGEIVQTLPLSFRGVSLLTLFTAIIIGCMIYLLGGGFQTGAQNLNYLWAGRWLAGLGVGFLVMIVPVYQYVYPEQTFLLEF